MFFKVQFGINSNNKLGKRWDEFCGYISPICNVCESVFPRIINWNLSGFALTELYTNHPYTFYAFCIRLLNMLPKFIPQE